MFFTTWQLSAVLSFIVASTNVSSLPLRILILTSSYNGTMQSAPQWTRGGELIPGALLAVDEVNDRDDILRGFELEPVVIQVPDCSFSEGIYRTVKEIVTSERKLVGIIGPFCSSFVRAIVPLVSSNKIGLVELSGAMALRDDSTRKRVYSNLYHVLPKVEYHVSAVLALMRALNWTKIALLSSMSGSDSFYTKAVEEFVRQVRENRTRQPVDILLHAEVGDLGKHDTTAESVIRRLEQSEVRITVAFLSPHHGFDLMCKALLRGLSWPRNAWILFDISLEDAHNTTKCDVAKLQEAVENVIIIKSNVQLENESSTLVSGKTFSQYMQSLRTYMQKTTHNPFTNVLYDSVWGLSIAINASLPALREMSVDLSHQKLETSNMNVSAVIGAQLHHTNFTGASGEFVFNDLATRQLERTVRISQVQNRSLVTVGTLSTSAQSAIFNLSSLSSNVPTDFIRRVHSTLHIAAATVLMLYESLCVLFVTIVIVVFVFYRNQVEVKATSRYLSVCIFIGCYLLLFGAIMHTVTSYVVIEHETSRQSVCIIESSSASIGLDLILATVFAKTLRIAYIFSHVKRTGRGWSDRALLCFTLLIASGKICLCCLWYGLDPYYLKDSMEYIEEKGHYLVTQSCYSRQVGVWLALVVAYSTLLCAFLAVLAYKTRKIERENFKDTKKLNALITGIVMTCVVSTALWGILRLAGLSQASKAVASTGYTLLPLLCQVFLFLPKIYPPFRRHVEMLRPVRRSCNAEAFYTIQYYKMSN